MDSSLAVEGRLRIFISSTISECSAERVVARDAIRSLNHSAFLFEYAGAHPYSPRELFLPRIDQSHIFVGIYKDSYGWVAPSSSESGVAQEFHRAQDRGMRRLLYVSRDSANRDPRLRELLKSVEEEVTFSYFDDPQDLYGRIRDDIENVVAETFQQVDLVNSAMDDGSSTVKSLRSLPEQGDLRPGFLEKLESAQEQHSVNLSGQSGEGKTWLLVALAAKYEGVYASSKGYDRHLLCSVLVNGIRRQQGLTPEYFFTPEESFAALIALWNNDEVPTRLYIDDLTDDLLVVRVLAEGKHIGPTRRIVTTSASMKRLDGVENWSLPTVSAPAALEYLRRRLDQDVGFNEATLPYAFGNPLFLHLWCNYPALRGFKTLQQMAPPLFRDLSSDCQELIAYVALGEERLLINEIAAASSRDIPEVFKILNRCEHFLKQSETTLQFQHSHQLRAVLSLLAEQPLWRSYLQRRLARALNKQRSPLRAFLLLDALGDPQAIRFAAGATFEAASRGDNRSLLQVLRRRLASRELLSDGERVALLLTKAHAERQSALDTEASASLSEAERTAQQNGDVTLLRDVYYISLLDEVSKSLQQQPLSNLVAMVDSIDTSAEPAIKARYSVDLSALYIRLNEYPAAAFRAREALALFTRIDDEYGIGIAKKNLVGALSNQGGHEDEVQQLTKELETSQTTTGSVRDRAWLCNLRTRECRLAGRLDEAFAYASEAIEIAIQLGDARLKAVNQLNLGNVLRDQKKYDSAVEHYLQACKGGFEVGDLHLEASASRLASATYMRTNSLDAALSSAQYAVSRVDGSTATESLIDALEQLGDVQMKLREPHHASETYGRALQLLRQGSYEVSRLLLFYLKASADAGRYMKAVSELAHGDTPVESSSDLDHIQAILEGYEKVLELSGGENILDLTELHLQQSLEHLESGTSQILFEKLLHAASLIEERRTRSMALLSLLVTMPLNGLAMRPLEVAGEAIAQGVAEIAFRPQRDGASHWVLSLRSKYPILVVVRVVDDRPSSCLIAVAIVLFFWASDEDIKQDLLAGLKPPKNEVEIRIVHRDEIPRNVLDTIPESDHGLSVSRAVKPHTYQDDATLVVYEDKLLQNFKLRGTQSPGLLLLLVLVLTAFCDLILLGQIDEEQLSHKIAELIRRRML